VYVLDFDSEHASNEAIQPHRSARFGAERLAFADHVNRLVAGQRAPGSPERPKMLAGFHPALDGPMILFHHVIELTPEAVPALFVQNPVGFELCDRRRVGAMAVGVDDSRRRVILSA